MAFFDEAVEKYKKTASTPKPATIAKEVATEKSIESPKTLGGFVGEVADILSTPLYGALSALQTATGLEKGKSFFEKFQARPTSKDVLRQLGEKIKPKSTLGKLVTGTLPRTPIEFGPTRESSTPEFITGGDPTKEFLKELVPSAIGLTADIVIDPLAFLGKMGLVKDATSAAAKPLKAGVEAIEATKTGKKAVTTLARGFVDPRYGQPELFKEMDKARIIEEALLTDKIDPIIEPVLKERSAVQQRIQQVLRGGITTDEHIRSLAEPIRQELDRVGKSITEINPKLLSEETFQANKGTYFPRLFEKYEFPEQDQISTFFNKSPVRIPGARFEQKLTESELSKGFLKGKVQDIINDFKPEEQLRITQILRGGITTDEKLAKAAQDISQLPGVKISNGKLNVPTDVTRFRLTIKEAKRIADEADISLGLITEAGFPAAKGITQLNIAEIRGKFFKKVNDEFASNVPHGDLVQLPETKLLGELSGKYVSPEIADAINGIFKIPTPMEKKYLDALALWKSFKTAYNPATISRNDLTNLFVLNPLGGVPFYRLDIYMKAANELLGEGQIWRSARQAGLNISNQSANELVTKANRAYNKNPGLFKEFFNTAEDFHKTVLDFYGNQDKFFKLANIVKGVTEDGLTMTQAVKRANFYLIDYSEMPEVINFLRTSPLGIPFISFTYGVSKPLAKTLLERPDKLANYFKILRAIQDFDPYQETKEQRLREYNALPDYIKEGQFSKVPFKDKFGRTSYVDLQYLLPFNPIETRSFLPGNPLYNIIADLQRNVSGFSGKEIWKESDTPDEKKMKIIKYAWQQLVPNNPLIPGSWSFEKMQDTGILPRLVDGKLQILPRPDKLGRERDQILGILDTVFGIKVTPIDVRTEEIGKVLGKRGEINELKSDLLRVMRSKTLLPLERQKQIIKLRNKISEVSNK